MRQMLGDGAPGSAPQRAAMLAAFGSWRVRCEGGCHWRCDEAAVVQRPIKPFDFLLLVMTGRLAVTVAAETAVLTAGEYLLVAAGVRHAARLAAGCAQVEACTLHATVSDEHGQPALPRLAWHGRLPSAAERHRHRRLHGLSGIDRHAWNTGAAVLLRSLLADHIAAGGLLATPPPAIDGRVLAAQEWICTHLADDPGVEAIAAVVGCSSVRLRQLFRQHCGCGIGRWRQRQRLRRACRSLRGGDEPIADIAQACGYGDERSLRRALRRTLGVTPGAYRQGMDE